ncbi:hypothetical protein [Winogradskyella sp.]|uniref:hypothetical protein n=1 Tax=Winogradskyella sp. TaxID=1883156 RepID=UPI001B102AA6|nr:hypothetical protein [Winogradskyella sp.]MBO6880821.1 hypothetical protein [Winogradskyella sp.]
MLQKLLETLLPDTENKSSKTFTFKRKDTNTQLFQNHFSRYALVLVTQFNDWMLVLKYLFVTLHCIGLGVYGTLA